LSASKDFFIFEIALHFSNKLNIPLILSIADDYVFYDEYHGRFLNTLYRYKYLKLIDKCFKKSSFCIFESDKIKEKYIKEYGVRGYTIFIASDMEITACNNVRNKHFCYFGNLEYGRADSLIEIANNLLTIDQSFILDIYSKDCDDLRKKKCPKNIRIYGQIPYTEVVKKMRECFCLLIVEGFDKKNVEMTRYSLSTKVGDSLSVRKPILVYGDKECGAIEFFIEKGIGYVATNKIELGDAIRRVIAKDDFDILIERQIDIRRTLFDLDTQSQKFKDLVMSEMED